MKNVKRFFILVIIDFFCLALIAGFGVDVFLQMRQQKDSEQYCHDFQMEIASAKRKHQTWLHSIEMALAVHAPSISIVIDDKECEFGKWYYGDGKKTIIFFQQKIQDDYHKIESVHQKAHHLGKELIEMWNPAAPQPSLDFIQNQIFPVTNELQSILDNMNAHLYDEVEKIRAQQRHLMDLATLVVILFLILSTASIAFVAMRWMR